MMMFDDYWHCKHKPRYFSSDGRTLCKYHWEEQRKQDIVVTKFSLFKKNG